MNYGKVGPKLKARILHLASEGCPGGVDYHNGRTTVPLRGATNVRAIEAQLEFDGTPLSRETVRQVLKDAKAQALAGEGTDEEQVLVQVRGTGPARGGVPAGESAGVVPVAGEGEEQGRGEPVLPEGAGERARLQHARLVATMRVSSEVLARVRAGSVPTAQWTEIEKEVSRQTERYYDALPVEKLDPKHNPTNLASGEVLIDRICMKVRSTPDRRRAIGR